MQSTQAPGSVPTQRRTPIPCESCPLRARPAFRKLSPQELAELAERLAGPPPGDGRDSGEPGR